MCGRYTLIQTEGLHERFDTENKVTDLRPNYNAAPTQLMPVITRNSPNKLEVMKWGLLPVWAKDSKIAYSTFNARMESVAEKATYKASFRHHRCLVPCDGFYEWKKEGTTKQPYYIRLKSQETFAFAGLYNIWQDSNGNELPTYTIITTQPNSLMEGIHDRMPCILKKDDEATWIDPTQRTDTELLRYLSPFDADLMEAYLVSKEVNKATINGKELILPLNSK